MLKMMRHHAKYFYVLFFIIILSFLFWGVGTVDKTSSGGIVAEVGKQKITQEEYYRAYDNAFKFYRDLYKEKFDEETIFNSDRYRCFVCVCPIGGCETPILGRSSQKPGTV